MVLKDGKATIECFYKITYKIDCSKGLEEWADIIKDTFDESVRAHEIADVDVYKRQVRSASAVTTRPRRTSRTTLIVSS